LRLGRLHPPGARRVAGDVRVPGQQRRHRDGGGGAGGGGVGRAAVAVELARSWRGRPRPRLPRPAVAGCGHARPPVARCTRNPVPMPESVPVPPARPRLPRPLVVAAVVVLLGVVVGVAVWSARPRLTEERVRTAVITTLAEEAPASFFVTGTLTFATTVEGRSDKTLLPGLLNLDLG